MSEAYEVDALRQQPRVYVRSPGVLWRRAAGSVLLLRKGSQNVVAFDDSACALWRLLDRPRALEEIVRLLAEAYGAVGEKLTADVAAALDRLISLELVTPAPEDATSREDTA